MMNPSGKNYYTTVLETVAVVDGVYAVARPSPVVGLMVNSVVTILGVSLISAGIPPRLPGVNCVSAEGSSANILMVITVADPTAAFSLALIVTALVL